MTHSKPCTKCKQIKPLSEFHKYVRSIDGHKPYCKECNKVAARQWHAANPEKVRIANRNWALNNPDKAYEIKKRWQINNPEKVKASTRRWQQDNAAHVKEVAQKWAEANKDKRANTAQRRRAKKVANGVFYISPKELKKLRLSPCFYCGDKSAEMDHVIPISRGGRHSIGNLVASCLKCNRSKSKKVIMEWRLDKLRE